MRYHRFSLLVAVGAVMAVASAPAGASVSPSSATTEYQQQTTDVAEGTSSNSGDTDDFSGDVLYVDAATGQRIALTEGLASTRNAGGFALVPYATASLTNRVVRFFPGVPAGLRWEGALAVAQINDAGKLGWSVGSDTTQTGLEGEITVEVVPLTDCSPTAVGCALNTTKTLPDGHRVITNTRIQIRSDRAMDGEAGGTVRHELGHAAGLGHYDDVWDGQYQVMRSVGFPGRVDYRSGDRAGIRQLAAAFTNPNVIGNLESVTESLGKLHLSGWVLDRDTPDKTLLALTRLDGVAQAFALADLPRADVAAAFPPASPLRGFTMEVPARVGRHRVCLEALGNRMQLVVIACRTVEVTGAPVGALASVRPYGPGGIQVTGWALDPDDVTARTVTVWVNGRPVGSASADRPYAAAPRLPGHRTESGFVASAATNLPPGTHQVCASANNTGPGPTAATWLGCQSYTTFSGSPVGSIDSATGLPGAVRLQGWVLDPDSISSTQLQVWVDGRFLHQSVASLSRPDVQRSYPGYNGGYGFDVTVTGVLAGTHQVCVTGVNLGVGSTRVLACRSVTLPGGNPFGTVAGPVTTGGTTTVQGWVIDPDTAAPVWVQVFANGKLVAAGRASESRLDVGRAFPLYGPQHGFTFNLTGVSSARICVYGINVGTGTANTLLGCAWPSAEKR